MNNFTRTTYVTFLTFLQRKPLILCLYFHTRCVVWSQREPNAIVLKCEYVSMYCGWCLVAFKMRTGLSRQDWDGSLATQTGGRHCCSSWTDQSQMFIVDKLDQSRQRRTVDWWATELNMKCTVQR